MGCPQQHTDKLPVAKRHVKSSQTCKCLWSNPEYGTTHPHRNKLKKWFLRTYVFQHHSPAVSLYKHWAEAWEFALTLGAQTQPAPAQRTPFQWERKNHQMWTTGARSTGYRSWCLDLWVPTLWAEALGHCNLHRQQKAGMSTDQWMQNGLIRVSEEWGYMTEPGCSMTQPISWSFFLCSFFFL